MNEKAYAENLVNRLRALERAMGNVTIVEIGVADGKIDILRSKALFNNEHIQEAQDEQPEHMTGQTQTNSYIG